MPATPSRPAENFALCEMFMIQDQKEFSNLFWFSPDWDDIPDPTNLKADTHDIVLAMETKLKPVLSNAVTIKGGYVEYGDGTGDSVGFDYYADQAGVVDEDAMPEDVAVVVQKYTTEYTRSGRGRWYFSGTPDTFVTGSYLNVATGQAAFTVLAAALVAQIVTDDSGNTYSPYHFGPTTPVFKAIGAIETVALLGTRRRRRFRF